MDTKICSKCKKALPRTVEFYYLDKRRINSLRSWCRKCEEKRRKKYYKNNIEHCREQRRNCFHKHKEKYHKTGKLYRINHRQQTNANAVKRRRKSVKVTIDCRMSNSIWRALKQNKANRTWESLVGYTLDDLIKRLKKTMPSGYTWNDVLNGNLHIHHIKAKVHFKYTDPSQASFKACWALDNLMLLNGKENLSRGAKVEEPFQLLLAI